ncbi:MAG TPA: response regulator [Pseudomonadales bacterium]
MAYSTALVVDDSKLARVTLRKKLEAYGLTVEFADSAADAFAKLPVVQPDIIFMDHLMPGMDGFEATRQLRAQGITTPVIMCTGKEHDGYLQEALAIGANHILGKPPVDEELEAVLGMEFAVAATVPADSEAQLPTLEPEAADADMRETDQAAALAVSDTDVDVDADIESLDDTAATDSGADADDDEFDMGDLAETLDAIDTLTETLMSAPDTVEQDAVPAQAVIDNRDIIELVRAELAAGKESLMNELMTVWTSNADEPSLDEQEIHRIVSDVVEQQKAELMAEVDKTLSESATISDGSDSDVVARIEEVLHPRLIELKASLLSDVERKMAQLGSGGEVDINDLLDLRLNVLLAERMSVIDKRLQQLEEREPAVGLALPADGIPLADDGEMASRFMMSEKIIKHLDQLIEENNRFARDIRQIRLFAGAAIGVAVVAAAIALAGLL